MLSMRDKPANLLKLSRNDWSANCLHHTQFRSSLIPHYMMRFTLTIIFIIIFIKNKHLLSDYGDVSRWRVFDEMSQIPVRHASVTASLLSEIEIFSHYFFKCNASMRY